jgi:hypothetical protein
MKMEKPDQEDFLISAEVKTKSKAKKSYSPLKKAIEGAITDSISRLAVTLSWLRERYIKDADTKNIRYLDRFIESPTFGPYGKHFKAVAVLDKQFLQDELSLSMPTPPRELQFEALVIAIDRLKEFYEKTYKDIEESKI